MEGVLENPEECSYSSDIDANIDDKQCIKAENICQFYLEGKCRFGEDCNNLHEGVCNVPKNKKQSNKAFKFEEEKNTDYISKKKPPLRTAGDVRKRIQWDEDLPEEYFSVGYLDRFDGIVEKPFSTFSWIHPAMADIDELAIPQHRIHYFKYKDTKVWDKDERLDNVFGSSNNMMTIQEAMKEIDANILTKKDNDLESDAESDDDYIITSSHQDNQIIADNCVANALRFEDERATHFICIKVNNDSLKSRVKRLQDQIVELEDILHSCCMPQELLHVTLAMVKCESPTAIISVGKLLQRLQPKITNILGPKESYMSQQRIIKSEGLSTFGARVLYTKLDVPSSFLEIVDLVREEVEKLEDTKITNKFEFVPHMTLLKINRMVAKERRTKYINSSLYSDDLSTIFGAIHFDNLHFCSIDDNRGLDGFYSTVRRYDV